MGLDDTTQEQGSRGLALEIALPDALRYVSLPETGLLLIGRSRSAAIAIDHESVSRAHAELVLGPRATLRDLGSRNGTFVRGRRLAVDEPVAIRIGDTIEIGSIAIRLAAAPATAPLEPARQRERRVTGSGRELLDAPDAWYASSSPAMREVFAAIARVAPSDLSVLVLGETGVGKEVCAEQLHRRSRRGHATLLRLNCSALPEGLIEGELFGYERGAFTGASSPKPGLIEAADGGTVFLDEIGELPAPVQAKLLRVLDRREVMRLGDTKVRTVDVRFVSATHRDLEAEATAGRFRRDLLYRLAGMTIVIPPLRERLDELPALAQRFVADAARRAGRHTPALSAGALAALAAHPWPGNIRELRNVMERAVLMCGDGDIEARHVVGIPAESLVEQSSRRVTADLRGEVEALERKRIADAIEAAGGNRSEAARRLGMSRGALLARLRAWGDGKNHKDPRSK